MNNLPDRRRTVSELTRFIDTRNETSASYSVFLGSGASVSSGVRTGTQLIDIWRKEQFLKLNPDHKGEYDATRAKEWLSKRELKWYNPQKEYSSLFERTFDLPRQRRIFVEREVASGFPSLGYAYLVRLIENNFFNTIFTTNFDDLMNEAFHQFSEVRPIVCAHDSSISSITFTSKRPKIIKLHGDYLFDDIKSTLRETETLEKNTRDKFIELAKEQGLIVVGYSGIDRSIMDVIEFLLKDDSYLKNGIYWCLRKEDFLGEELIKLLWKERVFWVEIDGFDEFFANLYSELCGSDLPVNTSLFNEHTSKIYDKYLKNNQLKNSKSEIVINHLTKLEKDKNSNHLALLFKSLTADDEEESSDNAPEDDTPTQEDIQTLLQIQNLEKERKFSEVITFVYEKIPLIKNKNLKVRLLSDAYLASRRIYDDKQAIAICEKLIDIDSKNTKYYRYKSLATEDLDEKIEILNTAIEINPYVSLNYLRKARILSKKSKTAVGTEREKIIEEMFVCINQSIQIEPSIENEAWVLKFNEIQISNSREKDEDLLKIINSLKTQSLYSPVVAELILDYCKYKKERIFSGSDVIDLISESIRKYYPENDLDGYVVLIEAYQHFNEKERLETLLLELDMIPEIKKRSGYIQVKASVIANFLADIPRAIKTIYQHPNFEKSDLLISDYIDYLIADEQFENAKNALEKYSSSLDKDTLIDKRIEFYALQGKSQEAINCAFGKKKNKYHEADYAMELSYLYLKDNNFKKAREVAKNFLEKVHFNINFDALILNY